MSRRNKLQKFAEVALIPYVYEHFDVNTDTLKCCGEDVRMRGRWHSMHFQNNHPITLELACGKGEYTLGLAEMFPERNIIGVDIKGARIWKGAKRVREMELKNTAFLRTRIELLDKFFEPGEVDEVWIVFPDPFPRESKANRRLTSPPFLNTYRKVLRPGGTVHLKTDDTHLFEYTLSVIDSLEYTSLIYKNADIYSDELYIPELDIKTFYEMKHLADGKKIKYVSFRID